MQKPDYQRDGITLYCGDCLDILPELSGIDLLLADPPYGTKNDCDYTRFSGVHPAIIGDNVPFDPAPFLEYQNVVLWGSNNFSDKLPPGALLVWDKKNDGLEGKFMSDAEVAWKKGGCGVFMFRHVWDGFNRASERGQHYHPSQKPVALMEWCIGRHKGVKLVCDPFMGSGPSAVACFNLGIEFIGIEKDPVHFATAVKRIEAALNTDRDSLWTAKQLAKETQGVLVGTEP